MNILVQEISSELIVALPKRRLQTVRKLWAPSSLKPSSMPQPTSTASGTSGTSGGGISRLTQKK